jgi:hypothetical protein
MSLVVEFKLSSVFVLFDGLVAIVVLLPGGKRCGVMLLSTTLAK